MPQHVEGDVLDVLRRDVAASLEEGHRAGAQPQVDRRPRRSPVVDQRHEVLQLELRRVARGRTRARM